MKKDIYSLAMFESTFTKGHNNDPSYCTCRRVPGGWIFTEYNYHVSDVGNPIVALSAVFVPYNDDELVQKKFDKIDLK